MAVCHVHPPHLESPDQAPGLVCTAVYRSRAGRRRHGRGTRPQRPSTLSEQGKPDTGGEIVTSRKTFGRKGRLTVLCPRQGQSGRQGGRAPVRAEAPRKVHTLPSPKTPPPPSSTRSLPSRSHPGTIGPRDTGTHRSRGGESTVRVVSREPHSVTTSGRTQSPVPDGHSHLTLNDVEVLHRGDGGWGRTLGGRVPVAEPVLVTGTTYSDSSLQWKTGQENKAVFLFFNWFWLFCPFPRTDGGGWTTTSTPTVSVVSTEEGFCGPKGPRSRRSTPREGGRETLRGHSWRILSSASVPTPPPRPGRVGVRGTEGGRRPETDPRPGVRHPPSLPSRNPDTGVLRGGTAPRSRSEPPPRSRTGRPVVGQPGLGGLRPVVTTVVGGAAEGVAVLPPTHGRDGAGEGDTRRPGVRQAFVSRVQSQCLLHRLQPPW